MLKVSKFFFNYKKKSAFLYHALQVIFFLAFSYCSWSSFGHLMRRADSLEKTLMVGKIEGKRRRGHREWDGWMASPTQQTWVWANSGRWWRAGKPRVLQSMGSQRVRHDSRDWITSRATTSRVKAVEDVQALGHLFPDERSQCSRNILRTPLSPCWKSLAHLPCRLSDLKYVRCSQQDLKSFLTGRTWIP